MIIMTPEIYEALDFLYEFDTYEPYQEALKIIEDALQDAADSPCGTWRINKYDNC